MAVLTFHKVTALPQQLQPNSVYFVSVPAKPEYMEVYVTGTTASVVKRVLNENDIRALIQAELAGFQKILIVANIEERDNLNPTTAIFVLVLDASDDPTVESGSASYIYNPSTQQWIKIAEYESMDLILSWDKIEGRPTSPPSAIDDAVAKRHMHANKTQLDKVGEDAQGNFQYGGA
ncbi:MAG: hypothetical protein QXX12_03815, partial [Nanopusillaceae archaeon]